MPFFLYSRWRSFKGLWNNIHVNEKKLPFNRKWLPTLYSSKLNSGEVVVCSASPPWNVCSSHLQYSFGKTPFTISSLELNNKLASKHLILLLVCSYTCIFLIDFVFKVVKRRYQLNICIDIMLNIKCGFFPKWLMVLKLPRRVGMLIVIAS